MWEINKNTIPLYYLNKISNNQYTKFKKVKIDRIKLGKKIKETRKSVNYIQENLTSKLNTINFVINTYESGKATVSTLFIIEPLLW